MAVTLYESESGTLLVKNDARVVALSLVVNTPNAIGGKNALDFVIYHDKPEQSQFWLHSNDPKGNVVGSQLLGSEHFDGAKAEALKQKVLEVLKDGPKQEGIDSLAKFVLSTMNDERLQTVSLSEGKFVTQAGGLNGVSAKDGSAIVNVTTTDKGYLNINLQEPGRVVDVAVFENGKATAQTAKDDFSTATQLSARLSDQEKAEIRRLSAEVLKDGFLTNVEAEQVGQLVTKALDVSRHAEAGQGVAKKDGQGR